MVKFDIKNNGLWKYNGNEEEVVIPSYVDKIHFNAFKNCNSVKKVIVPATIKEIGESAFWGCQ